MMITDYLDPFLSFTFMFTHSDMILMSDPRFSLSAIQTCVSLLRQGRPAPHREARQKRRELRLKHQAEQEELELRMSELQTANEAKQLELENMRKVRRRETNT